MSHILVTGGSGYIGIHTVIKLIEAGKKVIIFDNFSNSSKDSINMAEKITKSKIDFQQGDLRHKSDIEQIFKHYEISSVIHFAGVKSVDESIINPLKYYENNILGSINLVKVMDENNVRKIVFSSSATVYGINAEPPLSESYDDLKPINPYGVSKLFVENFLKNISDLDSRWSALSLRYFNPIGAHKSGLIGEDPKNGSPNLMPTILNTISSENKFLSIFGGDYKTKDGTCIRDYIHIEDLAEGHIAALEKCENDSYSGVINLGTGVGYTVMDVLNTFIKVNKMSIDFKITERRNGDVMSSYADVRKAKDLLNWTAKLSLEEMCEDSWRWYQNCKKTDS